MGTYSVNPYTAYRQTEQIPPELLGLIGRDRELLDYYLTNDPGHWMYSPQSVQDFGRLFGQPSLDQLFQSGTIPMSMNPTSVGGTFYENLMGGPTATTPTSSDTPVDSVKYYDRMGNPYGGTGSSFWQQPEGWYQGEDFASMQELNPQTTLREGVDNILFLGSQAPWEEVGARPFSSDPNLPTGGRLPGDGYSSDPSFLGLIGSKTQTLGLPPFRSTAHGTPRLTAESQDPIDFSENYKFGPGLPGYSDTGEEQNRYDSWNPWNPYFIGPKDVYDRIGTVGPEGPIGGEYGDYPGGGGFIRFPDYGQPTPTYRVEVREPGVTQTGRTATTPIGTTSTSTGTRTTIPTYGVDVRGSYGRPAPRPRPGTPTPAPTRDYTSRDPTIRAPYRTRLQPDTTSIGSRTRTPSAPGFNFTPFQPYSPGFNPPVSLDLNRPYPGDLEKILGATQPGNIGLDKLLGPSYQQLMNTAGYDRWNQLMQNPQYQELQGSLMGATAPQFASGNLSGPLATQAQQVLSELISGEVRPANTGGIEQGVGRLLGQGGAFTPEITSSIKGLLGGEIPTGDPEVAGLASSLMQTGLPPGFEESFMRRIYEPQRDALLGQLNQRGILDSSERLKQERELFQRELMDSLLLQQQGAQQAGAGLALQNRGLGGQTALSALDRAMGRESTGFGQALGGYGTTNQLMANLLGQAAGTGLSAEQLATQRQGLGAQLGLDRSRLGLMGTELGGALAGQESGRALATTGLQGSLAQALPGFLEQQREADNRSLMQLLGIERGFEANLMRDDLFRDQALWKNLVGLGQAIPGAVTGVVDLIKAIRG
jgi:hypothetical protein